MKKSIRYTRQRAPQKNITSYESRTPLDEYRYRAVGEFLGVMSNEHRLHPFPYR